jgi:photosystem II stability/assembly factor-like uncharacterized protein
VVTSIVFTLTNPTVMYAATGEALSDINGIRGAGVFKSTDGGATWNQLSSTANANFYYVNRVAVSPHGATLLAATLMPSVISVTRSGPASSETRPTHPAIRLASEASDWRMAS